MNHRLTISDVGMILAEGIEDALDGRQNSFRGFVRAAFLFVGSVTGIVGGSRRRTISAIGQSGTQLMKLLLQAGVENVSEIVCKLARLGATADATPLSFRYEDYADERIPCNSSSAPFASHGWGYR